MTSPSADVKSIQRAADGVLEVEFYPGTFIEDAALEALVQARAHGESVRFRFTRGIVLVATPDGDARDIVAEYREKLRLGDEAVRGAIA